MTYNKIDHKTSGKKLKLPKKTLASGNISQYISKIIQFITDKRTNLQSIADRFALEQLLSFLELIGAAISQA